MISPFCIGALTVFDEVEPVLAFDVVADKADFGAVISTEVGVSKISDHVVFLGNILLIVVANQVGAGTYENVGDDFNIRAIFFDGLPDEAEEFEFVAEKAPVLNT